MADIVRGWDENRPIQLEDLDYFVFYGGEGEEEQFVFFCPLCAYALVCTDMELRTEKIGKREVRRGFICSLDCENCGSHITEWKMSKKESSKYPYLL